MVKQTKEYFKQYRRKNKQLAVDYKGGKCQVCGLVDDTCVYDFHHTDPSTKEFMIADRKSFGKVKKELDKCIMVCANCHRKIHIRGD